MQLRVNFNEFKLFEPNNKYKIFHKDIIDENFNIIKSNRSKIVLSGVLDINTKMSYGYDKNRNPYKLFIPFNRNFPNFIVSYKNKKVESNKIISIKFISWLNEFPLGENIETYGNLNPLLNQLELINIYEKSLVNYNGYTQIKRNKTKYDINKLNEIFYTDIHNQNFKLICNIDPPGCTDIDDVISYSEIDEYKIIGIHISDVAYVLKLFDQEFNEKDRYCTIYPGHGKPYNIINDDIIDNFLSLNPDKMRYVWSLYIYINDLNEIENIELKPEKIINKISYTYDQVDDILKTDNTSYLYYISEFCLKLSQTKYQNIEYDINNSHHLISILMIFYNHYVGEYLNKNPNTIYRINNKTTSYQFNSTNIHTNLNLTNYLHITSPIRRYIDQYNQNLLYDIYNEVDLDKINESLNEMKIINNKYKLCRLIDNIHDAKLININYDENKLYLKWLISEEKISDIIIDPLLEINNNEYKLINRINNKEIILKLNEIYKLEVKFILSIIPIISLIYF